MEFEKRGTTSSGAVAPFSNKGENLEETVEVPVALIERTVALIRRMTTKGQDKREKTIKGLECCGYSTFMDKCDECPYDGEDCFGRLKRDALELLKAQEPNEDWISRKRLKDEIQYYIDEAGWGDEINKALTWCLEFIDNQQAVKWE